MYATVYNHLYIGDVNDDVNDDDIGKDREREHV